jgi:hypothetical protein
MLNKELFIEIEKLVKPDDCQSVRIIPFEGTVFDDGVEITDGYRVELWQECLTPKMLEALPKVQCDCKDRPDCSFGGVVICRKYIDPKRWTDSDKKEFADEFFRWRQSPLYFTSKTLVTYSWYKIECRESHRQFVDNVKIDRVDGKIYLEIRWTNHPIFSWIPSKEAQVVAEALRRSGTEFYLVVRSFWHYDQIHYTWMSDEWFASREPQLPLVEERDACGLLPETVIDQEVLDSLKGVDIIVAHTYLPRYARLCGEYYRDHRLQE